VDIRDVARRAKVSTATVSRTVNQVATVDAQLAKRVWKAIEELGYYPNRQARALVSGRSRVFGLIVSEITNPFFPEIVQTFETLAVEQHYEILLTSTIHDPKRMELAVRRMIEGRVDGVAILTFGMEEDLLEHLRFRNLPLVFVDIGPKAPRVSNIRVDYADGIRQAVQHLAALRHQRIGFIAGPLRLRSAMARKDAFQASMKEIGLPVKPDFLVEGDHRLEGGKRALKKLAELRERPTAVLCSNDMTAIGVMREAFELNIKVPQDLSVIGFDDIRMAEFLTPPLTTVQMSQSELARLAFEALLKEVKRETPIPEGSEYVLKTHLVLRNSTTFPSSHTATGRRTTAKSVRTQAERWDQIDSATHRLQANDFLLDPPVASADVRIAAQLFTTADGRADESAADQFARLPPSLVAREEGVQMRDSSQRAVRDFFRLGWRKLPRRTLTSTAERIASWKSGGQDPANIFNCRQGDIVVNSWKRFANIKRLAMAIEVAMVVRGEDGICLEFSGEQAAGQGYASENADVSNADPLLW
jgi:LacI family transcriptional regulator